MSENLQNLLNAAISQIATNPQNSLQIFQQILMENPQQAGRFTRNF